jgi:micrococcal nuclease
MRLFVLLLLAATPMLAHAHPGGLAEDGCHRDSNADERHCHPERLIAKTLSTCDLKKAPRAGNEGVFFGPLVSVTDGDTFKAKVQGVIMDFRLAETDAPEKDQPYGDASTKALEALLKRQKLVLVPIDTDRNGRTVVFVWTRSTCVNREMVRRGAAWFYDEFSYSAFLHDAEQEARKRGAGLWALPQKDRIAPHVWRREDR